jgi:predicted naringenin-chalcone synthase
MVGPTAHIHAIGTAVPDHDIHQAFINWAETRLAEQRDKALFRRMAARSGIAHRWSVLPRAPNGGSPVEPGGFYQGGHMPSTGDRMTIYADKAPDLALAAIRSLAEQVSLDGITHLVLASCTGFVAPGIDQILIDRLRLGPAVERTVVGFMGCYAAVAALRVAHHIARSDENARILVVTVELSSLHLTGRQDLEALLAALQFGDGAAAALVSAAPAGLALERFFHATLPDSKELIQWIIGDTGFEMTLSGQVPGRIGTALHDPALKAAMFGERTPDQLSWAVHAGGRSILDAVETGLALPGEALDASRSILWRFGNMSSATLMFVLAHLMDHRAQPQGVALAFGPGLAAEGFGFSL